MSKSSGSACLLCLLILAVLVCLCPSAGFSQQSGNARELILPRMETAFPRSLPEALALGDRMSEPVALRQSWLQALEPRFQPTSARMAWSSGDLWIMAEMQDDHARNLSDADQQNAWELGDVFEVFLLPEKSPHYAEIHVTPENRRLGLRFRPGDADWIARGKQRIDQHKTFPLARLTSATWKTRRGWVAILRIPWTSLGCRHAVAFRYSLCRYDASPAHPPVLSSSSPHKQAAFHRIADWGSARISQTAN